MYNWRCNRLDNLSTRREWNLEIYEFEIRDQEPQRSWLPIPSHSLVRAQTPIDLRTDILIDCGRQKLNRNLDELGKMKGEEDRIRSPTVGVYMIASCAYSQASP